MKITILKHTYQRCALAILILFSLSSSLKAQGYVYFTYDDFLHQKYTRVHPSNFMFYENYPNELKGINNDTKWKSKDTWGYVWNQSLYVQADVTGAISGVHIFKVVAVGEYVLYSYFAVIVTQNYAYVPIHIYYVSKTLNSQLYRADRKHISKLTEKDPVFSKLEIYMKKAPRSQSFEEIVAEYIKNSKEYKPISDLVPKEEN